MSVSTRNQLGAVRERTRSARERRAAAQKALDAAHGANDQQAAMAAEVALQQALGEVEVSQELENVLLRQASGMGGGYGESFLQDPDAIRTLERLAHSSAPIGSIDLGTSISQEGLVDMLNTGAWGPSSRMRADAGGSTPGYPVLPDSSRIGPFYGVVPQLRRRIRLLDLLPSIVMEASNSFYYVQEAGSLDGAAEVAESTVKPEGDLDLNEQQAVARTIAVWSKLRRQQLSDVPGLGTTINQRLHYSIARRLEDQIVSGDGTGQNLLGILNTPGVPVIDYTSGMPLADLALAGITGVLQAEAEPDAVVLNPQDWSAMLAAKATGSGERLDSNGAMSTNADSLWGLPTVISTVLPAGTALVGQFAMGAAVFVREGINVRASDSDQDDFVRNRVTILAEGRFALAVWQPLAFAAVQFAPTIGESGYSGPSGSSGASGGS